MAYKDPGKNESCIKWNKEKSTGNHSGGEEAENQNNLEHKEEKSIQSEQQEEQRSHKKWEQNKESLGHLNDRYARRRRGRARNQKLMSKKIMKENFLNLMKEIDIQVQEAQRIPNKLDPKRNTPRHITIKMPNVKDKERTLKSAREKQRVTYKGVPIRLSADFSKETL